MPELSEIPKIDFNPSNPASSSIEVVDLRELNKRKADLDHDIESQHRVRFNLIIYIREGSGSHFVDFTQRRFRAGSVIFIRRNQIHAFDLSSRPQGSAILFTNDFLELVLSHIKVPIFSSNVLHNDYSPVINLSGSVQRSLENLSSEISNQLKLTSDGLDIVIHLFSSLLLLLEREKRPTAIPDSESHRKRQRKVAEFIALIENEFTRTRSAADYADQLHISYKTLNEFCKSVTQLTAKQLIDKYTILEAKRRLVLEDKPVQLLSSELGFDEETNFVKYFKKHTLLTPRKFRQSH